MRWSWNNLDVRFYIYSREGLGARSLGENYDIYRSVNQNYVCRYRMSLKKSMLWLLVTVPDRAACCLTVRFHGVPCKPGSLPALSLLYLSHIRSVEKPTRRARAPTTLG